jgi:uncharacterized protein YjiS (DUF1127 family)
MRTIAVHDRALQASGWLSNLGRTMRHRYSGWAEHRRAAATARVLYNATDTELRDMGLNRGDIPAVVAGTYRRD